MKRRVSGYPVVCHSEGGTLCSITILIILAIVALALFVWRNMAGRRI